MTLKIESETRDANTTRTSTLYVPVGAHLPLTVTKQFHDAERAFNAAAGSGTLKFSFIHNGRHAQPDTRLDDAVRTLRTIRNAVHGIEAHPADADTCERAICIEANAAIRKAVG